jgi:ABC-type amino acid transport substrate-binding protein
MHARIGRSVSAVIGAGLAGVAAASAAQEVASPEAAPIVFCAGAANMPMSQAGEPSGFDVEIAEAIAAELGRAARFKWLEPESDGVDHAVREGHCDAALGVLATAGPLVGDPVLDGLALTLPYLRAGYRIVRRPDTAPLPTLEHAGDERIAVEGESVATFTLRQRGRRVYVLFDHAAVLEAVADGRVRYGYLWGPLAAWGTLGRDDVVLAREFEPVDRWSFALAVREEDEPLRRSLDGAITRLRVNYAIDRILGRYGLPPTAGLRR